ncbi:MAG: hypothetical protein KA731_01785 [Candidatus Moranbacteria bacterium]|nr:hypothetical protein [Candidatus Moranbacteria bacterium]
MLSKIFSEKIVSVLLVIFLVWFVNPFGFWMTDAVHMTLLGLIVTLFSIFAMFLWKESVMDEREQLHRFIGTRFAYTAGGTLLLTGIIVQALSHKIDPWLPLVLTGMVLAKILGRYYAEKHY